ncbi:MAG TPA: nucleotidyltransferase domain-containing protein [Anaerolineae bacterium]|nr:nucleotidyltransferase domain-containing protein [Anaerolineae bacterium]HQI83578.1 nucleotidyltransferase domain-containing protein [Anaerolineae bacterium]
MNTADQGTQQEQCQISNAVLAHYPETQAIYLFGSYQTADERPDSDVDIALLLPPQQAKAAGSLALSTLRSELEACLGRDVDLVNLRQAPTVLQKEVVAADRRIYLADEYAAAEFEMLTFSYYQKLNEERGFIIRDALTTGRFVA